jgi:hypothetical protein
MLRCSESDFCVLCVKFGLMIRPHSALILYTDVRTARAHVLPRDVRMGGAHGRA